MVGHDQRVSAAVHCQPGIFNVLNALQDQLAAPALLDPLHVAPIQCGVELLRRPFRQGTHVFHAFHVAHDVAEAAAPGAQHAQAPTRFGHHVGNVGQRQLGGGRQAVLQVFVALAKNLQVQREHQRRASGCFGAVNQAFDEIAVLHHVQLKPERVSPRALRNVFDRADAHRRQRKRNAEALGRACRQDLTIGVLHAGQPGWCNRHRHGHVEADHFCGRAAVFHVHRHALAELDALEIALVGAVGALRP